MAAAEDGEMFHEGMREAEPAFCWRYVEPGRVCILDRGHNGGAHENTDRWTLDTLYVNEERTVLVRVWSNGVVEVARRDHPAETWRAPIYLKEEK